MVRWEEHRCRGCNGTGCGACKAGWVITYGPPKRCLPCNSTGVGLYGGVCPHCRGTGYANGKKPKY